jgi:hypothetical protein
VLEECLVNGRPLLVENVEEELDPVLDPVLERRYIRKGALPSPSNAAVCRHSELQRFLNLL